MNKNLCDANKEVFFQGFPWEATVLLIAFQ